MTRHVRGIAALSASLLVLAGAGCTVGPDYVPPKTEAPAAWTEAPTPGLIGTGPEADKQLDQWWTGFKDPTLDRLVTQAIADNLDLKIAEQHLAEARAARESAAAGLLPTLDASASAERQRYSTALKFPPFGGVANTFQAGFDASWEIDVFGKIRRGVEAADATIGAQVESRRDVLVSLLAELGRDYAALRSAQARLVIAQSNIKADQDTLDLTHDKFVGGLGNELDVAQAQAQLQTLNAAVPQLQAIVATQAHAIGVLLGQEPGALEAELSIPAPLPVAPPTLPAALPSDVVRNRPDIRAAERQIAGANAQIGVAIAQMFPSFSITPSFGVAGWFAQPPLEQWRAAMGRTGFNLRADLRRGAARGGCRPGPGGDRRRSPGLSQGRARRVPGGRGRAGHLQHGAAAPCSADGRGRGRSGRTRSCDGALSQRSRHLPQRARRRAQSL
jgi:NodT family efflux transporter outer membrane factor (OMF) lipoprotein